MTHLRMTMTILLLGLAGLAAACGIDDTTASSAEPEPTTTTAAPEPEQEDVPEPEPEPEPAAEETPEPEPEAEADEPAAEADTTDDVAALVVRRVTGDVDTFVETRDAYVADLEAQPGIVADREFLPFLSFTTFAQPEPPVYIGLTSGASLPEFGAAAENVAADLQGAYFPTFEIEVFDILTPLEPGTPVDIASIAVEPGHVLEVAWRDLSSYADFVEADYAAARDAYLTALSERTGFVAEYQWVSATGSGIVVGMTVYESAEAFQAIATDAEFTASEVYTDFVGGYPIAGGYASSVLK